ncbi:transporter [Neobacillus niacini]
MSPIQEPSQQPRLGGGQQHGPQHPPFGGGQQGFPPMGGGQHHDGAPSTPPPSHTPQESVSAFAVDPGAIRGCLHRFTFVWLNNGRSFWFYPTFVGRDSVAGYRWRGFRWVYYGTDLRRIRSFRCT